MDNIIKVFILPLLISLIVQVIKILIDIYRKRFSWAKVFNFGSFGFGGMPSSHAALVAAVATAIYVVEGPSVIFALSLVIAILVVQDAISLRGYLSQHSIILNKLIKDLPDQEEFKYPVLEERIKHTRSEIMVGAILGVILTLLLI